MKKILLGMILVIAVLFGNESEDALKAYNAGDYAKAVKLYKMAVKQGDIDAQYALGFMYEEGKGVKQDYAKARELYMKAAKQGSIDAQTNLGAMYDDGRGVKRNYKKAVEFYKKAAKQGGVQLLNLILALCIIWVKG